MTPSSTDLSIIIVNFNSTRVLRDCLRTIVESELSFPYEVFVIDNDSEEEILGLAEEYPFITLISNDENRGFAYANNIGIKHAHGKYLLLLNPDTIVNSGSLGPMIAYLESHPNVGIVGCRILNPSGLVEHSTHSFPTLAKEFVHANQFLKSLMGYDSLLGILLRKLSLKSIESYWEHDTEKEVDHVTGACMMVRRDAVEKAGLLDEAFFLYNEEVEWSYRIRQAGYRSIFLPNSTITHLFGYSTKQQVQKQVANKLLVERYRGMFYFFQKHYGLLPLTALRLIVIEGFALRLAVYYIKYANPFSRTPDLLQEIRYLRTIIGLAFAKNFDWRVSV